MKALVGAFNQEKALVGAFSVIVQPVVEPMDRFTALILIATHILYISTYIVPCHMYLTQVLQQLQIIDISIISWRGVARPGLGWGDVGGQQSHGWRQLRPLDTH